MISLKTLLKESDPEDMFGTAHLRIGPETPKGHSPVQKFKTPPEEDDEEKKKADDKLKIMPLEGQTMPVSKADRENVAFMSGVKMAVKDKATGTTRQLDGLPADFVRGYNSVKKTSWWDKFNDRLTQFAANLGNSYGKR